MNRRDRTDFFSDGGERQGDDQCCKDDALHRNVLCYLLAWEPARVCIGCYSHRFQGVPAAVEISGGSNRLFNVL